MKTREAELLGALFRYLAESIEDGDAHIVRDFGLTPEDVEAITALTLADLQHLSRFRGHCIKVEIDAAALRGLHRHILHERSRIQLRRKLLCADAPQPLMDLLFAMPPKDYDNERKCAGLPLHRSGRCAKPSDAVCKRVYASLRGLGHERLAALAPDEWLTLAQASGATVRELWALHRDETHATAPKPDAPRDVAKPASRVTSRSDSPGPASRGGATATPLPWAQSYRE